MCDFRVGRFAGECGNPVVGTLRVTARSGCGVLMENVRLMLCYGHLVQMYETLIAQDKSGLAISGVEVRALNFRMGDNGMTPRRHIVSVHDIRNRNIDDLPQLREADFPTQDERTR